MQAAPTPIVASRNVWYARPYRIIRLAVIEGLVYWMRFSSRNQITITFPDRVNRRVVRVKLLLNTGRFVKLRRNPPRILQFMQAHAEKITITMYQLRSFRVYFQPAIDALDNTGIVGIRFVMNDPSSSELLECARGSN